MNYKEMMQLVKDRGAVYRELTQALEKREVVFTPAERDLIMRCALKDLAALCKCIEILTTRH